MIQIINVGSCLKNIKTLNITKYECINKIYNVNRFTWANIDLNNSKAEFQITCENNKIKIIRIDSYEGWKFNLQVYIDIKYNLEEEIDISMTTLPERLKSIHFKKVYNSLLNQKNKFNKLIINLEINSFIYKIPKYLLLNENVILNKCDKKGSCLKLLGCLSKIPNERLVIIMDDDIVMRNNFIKILYECFKLQNDANVVVTNMTGDSNIGKKLNYLEVAGFGGYIFKMQDNIRLFNSYYKNMPTIAKNIDDQWISWVFNKIGVTVKRQNILKDPMKNIFDIPNTDPHPKWKELCKHTPRAKLIHNFYNLIK
jgi:hypothetical protein